MVENLPSPLALIIPRRQNENVRPRQNPKKKWDSSWGGLQDQRFAFQG